ncbi:MAG: AAA family ATPase [Rhodocyclaceae bacterium]|nr:AAA family ATPase [Rhodocyclaceae bacterium]
MKIAVISPSARSLETMGNYLREDAADRVVVLVEGGMSKLRSVAEQQRPHLVVVEGMGRDVDELGPLEYVTLHYPRMMVVMLCSQHTPEFLINAMRAGIKEVLPAPVTRDALRAAVARLELKLRMVAQPRPQGEVLAFIACKGGSGATFLATNLGYQLAAAGKKVLLIDFNLQFGDAVLYVHDRKPATNLADVARNVQRLDSSFLAASLVHVTPNYGVLAAPEDPGQAMEVRPEHVDALLNLAVAHYDFVIVDVGRILDAVTLRALDKANHIFPVLQMTLPFVRDANRLLAVFRSLGYASEKISLLINRFEKSGELTPADVERTLGVSGLRTIPNSYAAVAGSVNHGTPIAQMAKNNPVTKALDDFAQSLVPHEEAASGWLGRLLKRA